MYDNDKNAQKQSPMTAVQAAVAQVMCSPAPWLGDLPTVGKGFSN